MLEGAKVESSSLEFLKRLLDTPGPSGFEAAVARVWREEAERFADRVTADVSGNSFATVNEGGSPRVMLAGHIDEIGLMITHIDDDGFLYVDGIGGWDPQVLVGQRIRILGKDGHVLGVVGKKPIHLMKGDEKEKASKLTDLWVDIGVRGRDAVLRRGIRVGDPAVIDAGVVELGEGLIASRAIDNRIGAFVVLEALRLLSQDRPRAEVTAVATAQGALVLSDGASSRPVPGTETSARIPEGGLLEQELPRPAFASTSRLVLREPDIGTALRIAAAIDAEFGAGTAQVEDPGAVALNPPGGTSLPEFLARIGELRVTPDRRPQIVIDARDGTVVAGGALRVGSAVVSHAGMTLTIGGAQGGAYLDGDGGALTGAIRVDAGATVQEVAAALHAVGAAPQEIAAIFESLQRIGALAATVVSR